ncbi:RNA-binding protein 43 [Dendropsophus ebraccatus]|uniref:RNA-binding protein 43 n=1 Tax=Dendropsophus ebraccatus TaxID=150705 RepID=UPI003831867C
MADRRGVEVSGLPTILYDSDIMKDKLQIHFMQRKNGGGCDVVVHYPTEEAGTALLLFEDEKVAQRILGRRHSLNIEDCIYPLDVRRPQPRGSSCSMPVRTSLDLTYFGNVWEVKKLLERHRLSIYHNGSNVLGIKGDFCDLTSCRLELYKILSRKDPANKHGSLESTVSRRLQSERRDGRAVQRETQASELKSPSSHPSKRPKERENVAQDKVTRGHGNKLGGPTQRSSPSTEHHTSSTRSSRPPTPTRGQKPPGSLSQFFHVDSAIHTYFTTFSQDKIDNILRQHNIDMKEQNGEGFTSITLTSLAAVQPEDFEEACSEMKALYNYYNERLRTENIELPTSSRLSNQEITGMIQKYLLKLKICSMPVDDATLCIIGPSVKTLNFLQEWRGSRGQLARDIIGETPGFGIARSPAIGLDSKDSARNDKNSTQPGVSEGSTGGHEGGHDAHSRGKEKIPIEKLSSVEPTTGRHLISEEKGRRAPQGVSPATEHETPPSSSSPSHLSRPPEDRRNMAQDHTNNRGSPTQPSASSTTSARTPTHGQKASTLRSPSYSFYIDPAVHTYVRTLKRDKIDSLLRQHNIDMKEQNGEDFTSITLTSLAAAQPEDHEKACLAIKDRYSYYYNHLQLETIELPTDLNQEIIRTIPRYLLEHEICLLSVDTNTLYVIGPRKEVQKFKQCWGGFGSTRSPAIGLGSKDSTQPGVSDRRARGHEGGHDAHSRGKEKISMEKLGSVESTAGRHLISEENRRRAPQGVTRPQSRRHHHHPPHHHPI